MERELGEGRESIQPEDGRWNVVAAMEFLVNVWARTKKVKVEQKLESPDINSGVGAFPLLWEDWSFEGHNSQPLSSVQNFKSGKRVETLESFSVGNKQKILGCLWQMLTELIVLESESEPQPSTLSFWLDFELLPKCHYQWIRGLDEASSSLETLSKLLPVNFLFLGWASTDLLGWWALHASDYKMAENGLNHWTINHVNEALTLRKTLACNYKATYRYKISIFYLVFYVCEILTLLLILTMV